jgi:hypothetical protein
VNLVLVFPANMPSEVKTTTDSCPSAIDSKLVFLVKLTPSSNGGTFTTSSIGGKNAADFDIVADAYPARRGERFCLSGLVTCRFGRSLVVVVDNLPLPIFFHWLRHTMSRIVVATGRMFCRHLGKLNTPKAKCVSNDRQTALINLYVKMKQSSSFYYGSPGEV